MNLDPLFKFFELFNFFCVFWLYEIKRNIFAWQYIVTSTICAQMWDHGSLKASLVIDRGEEETISWVWMRSGRSKAFIPTSCGWHTRYPWHRSRTYLRPCSIRWWVCHEHGCFYLDGWLDPWWHSKIRTPLLLQRLRDLRVFQFCTTVYYILVARKPHFCIMTSHFGCLMKFFYDDRFYLFTCV